MESDDEVDAHIANLDALLTKLKTLRGLNGGMTDDESKAFFFQSLPENWSTFVEGVAGRDDQKLTYAILTQSAREHARGQQANPQVALYSKAKAPTKDKDPKPKTGCTYCHMKNHIKDKCFHKRTDEQNGIFQKSDPKTGTKLLNNSNARKAKHQSRHPRPNINRPKRDHFSATWQSHF